jgi:hypothetical protein
VEKMKSAKELGLPKGFTLTRQTRNKIITTAGKALFGEEVNALALEEVALFKQMYDEIYPPEKRKEYEACMAKMSSLFARKESSKSRLYTPNTYIRLHMPGDAQNYFGNSAFRYRHVDAIWEYCTLQHKDRPRFVWQQPTVGCAIVPEKEVFSLLTAGTQSSILRFYAQVSDLRKKVAKFREKLQKVLNTYSSAAELCNTFPEFVGWIRQSCDMEKPSCSDIPVADDMQEIRNMIKQK